MLLSCDIFERFFGGFSTTYLHNIDLVFIKCASKCFFVSCYNVIVQKGYIVTTNETFVCKKRLNKFPVFFYYCLFLFPRRFSNAFSKIFCVTTRICFFVSYMPIHFTGRILIHFVFQFAFCVDSFLKFFGYKGEWLPLKTFFFNGACLFTTSRNLFEIYE